MYVRDGVLSHTLDQEMYALEKIPISEDQAESTHAEVKRRLQKAPASSLPWLCASTRLNHNIDLCEALVRTVRVAGQSGAAFTIAQHWDGRARVRPRNPCV